MSLLQELLVLVEATDTPTDQGPITSVKAADSFRKRGVTLAMAVMAKEGKVQSFNDSELNKERTGTWRKAFVSYRDGSTPEPRTLKAVALLKAHRNLITFYESALKMKAKKISTIAHATTLIQIGPVKVGVSEETGDLTIAVHLPKEQK